MAGKMTNTGLDTVIDQWATLGQEVEGIAKEALYQGAGVMADRMNGAVANIKTEKFRYANGGKKRYASPEEKAALVGSIGIAKFNGDGSEVDTLVGITGSGYADVAGHERPVIVIARSINSGTDFMIKQPVFRRAASRGRRAAQETIVKTAEKRIEELTK